MVWQQAMPFAFREGGSFTAGTHSGGVKAAKVAIRWTGKPPKIKNRDTSVVIIYYIIKPSIVL